MKPHIFKISLIAIALMAFTSVASAQQVPDKVTKAFTKKFPNAQKVNWGMEGSDVYEAEFMLDGKEMSANFEASGKWEETELSISNDELPNAVKETLKRDFKEKDVEHAYKVTTPTKTVYEVVVANEGNEEEPERMEQKEEDEDGEHAENEQEKEEEYEEGHHLQELVFTADGKLINKEKAEED